MGKKKGKQLSCVAPWHCSANAIKNAHVCFDLRGERARRREGKWGMNINVRQRSKWSAECLLSPKHSSFILALSPGNDVKYLYRYEFFIIW